VRKSLNLLLAVVATFTVALTFYSCSRFYAYLPTSDTWIYTNFLAQAAQGHLDVQALFIKHNNVHLIVLPKLIYFFDMWLTNGTGALVMFASLIAMLATTAIFATIIFRIISIDRQEKIFLSLLSVIFLMSACQAESLMNPANLQWSLLVFTATLTAWFFYRYTLKKSVLNVTGLFAGMTLASLTSASPLLITIPLVLFVLRKKITRRVILASIFLALMTLGAGAILFSKYIPLIPVLLASWLKFTMDFLAPPVERLHFLPATILAGILAFLGLFQLAQKPFLPAQKETVFFVLLLLFASFTILVTGVARSYSPTAFTFRFVNIGLLFAAALFPLLYLHTKSQSHLQFVISPVVLFYIGVLTYVNVTEVSDFCYGRNHVRLTQVAHALDINDPFVVSALPGTAWEKVDFDFVQANKHFLKEAGTGIYGSDAYKHVGLSIDTLAGLVKTPCTTNIIKMRRLLPDQASYRLMGESESDHGKFFSRAYFVDEKNIIRGFAIPVQPDKNLIRSLFANPQWAGFVNLDTSQDQKSLQLYAYNDKSICQGEKIILPDYKDLRKKTARQE